MKRELLRKIDKLDNTTFKEAYGVLLNFINSKNDYNEWDRLKKGQKDAIRYGLKELDAGAGILHEGVIKKYRKKYKDA